MGRAAILLPLAALLTSASAPRDLCKEPGRTAAGYCTIVFFDFDSAEVPPSGWPILERVVGEVEDSEGARVVISGHTDSSRSRDYAVGLSGRMANSVRDYLVQQSVRPAIISVESYGDSRPRVPAKGKREPLNRRVEIWVTE